MKKSIAMPTTSAMLMLALATTAPAQPNPVKFPAETFSPESCQTVAWSGKMLKRNPRMIDACHEVVYVDNEPWARFSANFVKLGPEEVVFNLHDRRGRFVEQLRLDPKSNQVAVIDGRPILFPLANRHRFNLYVPEREFGQTLTPCESPGAMTQVD